MKKFATLVAAIALVAGASVANAADNLWFTVISGADSVQTTGPGQTLSLTTTPGATVRVAMNITSATNTLAGWNVALSADGGGTFSNGANVGTGYDTVLPGGPNGSNAFSAGFGSIPGLGSAGIVYEFDINVGAGPVDVTGDFGELGIAYANGFFWYGFVGPNPISYAGGPGYAAYSDVTPGWGGAPVIHIAIPEPATLGLLGLGVVALIRRRK